MKWRDYPQNIKVRLLTSFFSRTVSSAVMPFMALFFAQEINKVFAGIFLASTVIIGFLMNFIGGYIADRFHRKKVLLIASSLSAIMFFLMTISLIPKDHNILLFAIAYVAFIVSSSLEYPTMDALIIDSTTPENRKAIYAADYWLVNLAMAIGTALGGLLYVNHKIVLFILLTITSICLPIAYSIWLQDIHTKRLQKQHQNVIVDVLNNYKLAFQDTPFVKVVIGAMFIMAAEFSLNSYIGVRLAESFQPFHIGDFEVGGVRMLSILNIENMLLVVFLTFFINKITDRFSKQKVLVFGLIIYAIGYITVTSANIWYVLMLFNLIATIGELIYSPIFSAEQANMIPANQRGSYSAFSSISFYGADMIARSTIIMGAFLVPTMMSVFIGIIIMLGILFMYFGFFKRKLPIDA